LFFLHALKRVQIKSSRPKRRPRRRKPQGKLQLRSLSSRPLKPRKRRRQRKSLNKISESLVKPEPRRDQWRPSRATESTMLPSLRKPP